MVKEIEIPEYDHLFIC